MPNQQWIEHAYPLKRITVQVQGTRHSDLKDMADQLRRVADLIDAGQLTGKDDDDDFGYCFTVESDETQSIFPSRLEQAIELLGYAHAKELHHQSNLIHAISLFAGISGDANLEAECEREIQRIRAEVAAKQEPVAVSVNVGDNQRNAGRGQGGIQINIGRNQRNCGGDFHER